MNPQEKSLFRRAVAVAPNRSLVVVAGFRLLRCYPEFLDFHKSIDQEWLLFQGSDNSFGNSFARKRHLLSDALETNNSNPVQIPINAVADRRLTKAL